MAFPWGPVISATGSVLGGYLTAREQRRHREQNSVAGRIEQGKRYGINPLVSIGASPSGYAGGALGGGLAAAGRTVGQSFSRRGEMDAAQAAQWNQHRYNIQEIHQRGIESRRTLRLEHELQGDPTTNLLNRLQTERSFSRDRRATVQSLVRDFQRFFGLDPAPNARWEDEEWQHRWYKPE